MTIGVHAQPPCTVQKRQTMNSSLINKEPDHHARTIQLKPNQT